MVEASLGWEGTLPTPELMAAAEAGKVLAIQMEADAAAHRMEQAERKKTMELGAKVSAVVLALLIIPIYLGISEYMAADNEAGWEIHLDESVRVGDEHLVVYTERLRDSNRMVMMRLDDSANVIETAVLTELDSDILADHALIVDEQNGVPYIGISDGKISTLWMLESWDDPEWRHLVIVHDVHPVDAAQLHRVSSSQRFMRVNGDLAIILVETRGEIDPETGTEVWNDRVQVNLVGGGDGWLVRADTDAAHAYVGGVWDGQPSVGLVSGNIATDFEFETCALLPTFEASCTPWEGGETLPLGAARLDGLGDHGLEYAVTLDSTPTCFEWDGWNVTGQERESEGWYLCHVYVAGGIVTLSSPDDSTSATVQHDGIIRRDQLIATHWESNALVWSMWKIEPEENAGTAYYRFDADGTVTNL